MTLSSLSSRDKRALSIAAFVLIPSLLFVFVVKPFFGSITTIREQIEDEKSMLKRERGIAQRLPLLPEEKEKASEQLRQEAARLFVGEDELVATGHLAEYVIQLADQYGVTLQQSETRPGMQVAAGVRALQVEVRAEGDVYAVLNFLQALETGEKLIRISSLTLEKSTRMPSFPTPQQPQQIQTQYVQPVPQQQQGRQRRMGGQRGSGNRNGMQSIGTSIGGGTVGMSTSIGVAPGTSMGVQAGQGGQQMSAAREAAMAQYRAAMAAQQALIRQQQGQRMPTPMPQQPPQPVEILSLTASVHGYRLDGVPFNMDGVDIDGAPSPFERQISGLVSLEQVIDRNPFDPNRRAPNTNRFAGGGGQSYEQPALRLSGTGISENYSFALISMGADPKAQVVPVGGNAFGYTLMDVTSQTAVLRTPTGGTMVLRTAPPGTYASSGPVQSIGGLPPGMARPMAMPSMPDMNNMTPQQREQMARQIADQLGRAMGGGADSAMDVIALPAPTPEPPAPSRITGGDKPGSSITKPKQTERMQSKPDSQSKSDSLSKPGLQSKLDSQSIKQSKNISK